MDKTKIIYKGKWLSRYYCASFGPIFRGKDKVTIYFDAGNTGSADNFFVAFGTIWQGFVSDIGFNTFKPSGCVVYGHGRLKMDEMFGKINNKNAIDAKLKRMTIFKTSVQNVIAIKVDMTQQKNWIWNEIDTNCKLEINLYEQCIIGVGMGGTEDKTISVQQILIE